MRKKFFIKVAAVYLSLNLLFEILFPTLAFALTGGPAQPESSSFTPVGTSDMVSLFSGDYNYNIPLMDVGGYPVNISYQSGISMDQEASWVGLGWNINPGAINRSMRGLPDDFNGEAVIKEFNVKPNQTYGVGLGFGAEVAGFDALKLHFSLGVRYNNYTGVGFEMSANAALSAGETGKTGGTASLGLHSSADGLDISPSISASVVNDRKEKADNQFGASIGSSFNSRSGLKALTINTSIQQGHRLEKDEARTEDVGKFSAGSSSIGTGCSISMANNTYIPSQSMPMRNLSVNASFKMGATFFSIDGSMDISGYFSQQRLAEKRQEVAAYGFLYSQNGAVLDKVLLDFNREKEGSFTKNTPNLPLTNFSYDIFSVSGQGVGGVFRPFRSDLGYVFDSRTTTTSEGYSASLELGGGNLFKGGGDITINDVNSTSGKWVSDNTAANLLQFRKTGADEFFEPCYFKEEGEKNVDSYSQLYTDIGADSPVRIGLGGNGHSAHATTQFRSGENESSMGTINIPLPTSTTHPNYRLTRQRRNQLFSYITSGEYEKSAVYKNLYTNTETTPLDPVYKPVNKKQIAEITTTKTDGSRYVYGIPAYNTKQKEVTFSVGSGVGDSDGLVGYNSTDNSTANSKGIDHYYSSTELPPYAHSYLLTAVLSPDYVDITGNGLTTDDYGTYTKFSYTKFSAAGNGIYNWRVPYGETGASKANFNEGLKTELLDNQGNYIYGEKEIWVLDKIETKNYVAVFTLKDGNRADGFDVAGENGGIGNNTTPVLKKISLYSRPEFERPAGTPVSIKEVHFAYDYSLCPGTLNNASTAGSPNLWTQDPTCEPVGNAGGKLTLKKIYFTYGNSFKAKFNPYTFSYRESNPDYNPSYGMKSYDRWGNYKPNVTALPNAEYPYVEQDKALADKYSSAWTLTDIGLPSGGTIHVDYESDDYAYVQDKRAMQMFKITGVGKQEDNMLSIDPLSANALKGGDYLFFKLQDPISDGTPGSWISENYLKGISDLYFRFLIKVNNEGDGKEYVSGYASIFSSGFATFPSSIINNKFTYGYIQLKNVDLEDSPLSQDVNPISKAAIQFARINTPKQAYSYPFTDPDPDPENVSMGDVLRSLANDNIISKIVEAFQGANGALYNKGLGFGQIMERNKCWVRLLNSNYKKLGGGSRVKKITISDQWASMAAGGQDFSYGQEYDYKKVENGIIISSGVASYEPMVGGDENPFRLPVSYSEKMKLAADLNYYKEEPFGESFFPSPSVGYSRVTVKNLQHANVKRHATGSVINEFYTARDFPVITKKTPVDAKPTSNAAQALEHLLKLDVKDYMTASQGFSIELNDMHGKSKATWVYAEDQDTYISGVEYKYKSTGNKLTNQAVAMDKNGTVNSNAQIGIDYDFVADMREQSTDVLNIGAGLQLYSMLTPFPVVIPPILPIWSSEKTRFRSASVTKVINRFGLLDETLAYDLGSKVSTKNLAYDSETGEVILTKTKNDFNDEVYSLNLPAHLAYDRMGPGYKNVGAVVTQALGSSIGQIKDNNHVFVPGDEIQISGTLTTNPSATQKRFWVSKEGNNLYAISESGNHVGFQAGANIKVIRSGRKNQQGLPIGSITSLTNPMNGAQLAVFDKNAKVLSAGASEYSEVWRNFCECGINPNDPRGPKNPYLLGLLGNWRAKKSYTFLSDRNQTKLNDNSNIRKDGAYSYFKQFWTPDGGVSDWTTPSDLSLASADWTWTSEITEYSPFGPELENQDALKRFSSAIYGYNNALPIAVSSNAQYREIAFDGFEDYDFGDCMDDHFSFELGPFTNRPSNSGLIVSTGTVTVTGSTSHSGKRSIEIKPNSSVSLTKTLAECPGK